MSMKDRLAAKAANIGTTPRTTTTEGGANRPPKTAPGQLMATLPLLAEKEKEIDDLRARLQHAETSSPALEAALSELHEIPGRRRHKSRDEYEELRENIRLHGLQHAITVRRREEGGYEILSGHHRWDVLKELDAAEPGRWNRVPIHVIDAAADKADEQAFYANLVQSALSDLEKFQGLKRLQDSRPELKTLGDIAQYTGVKESTVKSLWQMADLPETVVQMLSSNPGALGASAAGKLAKLVKDGKGEAVEAAVKALIETGITQQAAVAMASAAQKPRAPEAAKPVAIKVGRANYCSFRRVAKTVRVDFESEADAQEAAQEVEKLLQQLAEKKRGAGK